MDVLRRSAGKSRMDKIRNREIKEIMGVQEKPEIIELAALAQMVACLPLVQQVRSSIPGGAWRGGDVHFIIARFYITSLD